MKRPMRRINDSHHGLVSELNLTPLLDLVFVMLVIFIIATPQVTNNFAMSLPSGKSNASQAQSNVITLTGQNKILLNNSEVTLARLKIDLAAKKMVDPAMSVVVNGSADANYQMIVDVLDVVQQLQITKVGLGANAE